jgi:pimeloyl-ACP methyl ester carboxylesterase
MPSLSMRARQGTMLGITNGDLTMNKVMLSATGLLGFCIQALCGPCISASQECTEWLPLGKGQTRSLIYRTYSLDTKNEGVTRALVMIHGAGRDADNYFRTALAAAFLGGALNDTIVIAPRFASNSSRGCKDQLSDHEVNWSCSGDSWRSGGVSQSDSGLTSYDLVDDILRKLANKDVFPNLRAIVVAGHSAGGQYVTRYEMANKVHDKLGVPVTYVVSNPSSYAYPDATRPAPEGAEFRAFSDARNCTTFDHWPYGLEGRGNGYTASIPEAQLKKQLVERPTTYLLGEIDILPLGGFDGSCPAMAQGPTRLARGQAFSKYVSQKYGAQHKMVVVPLCGHNARCMFTSEAALPILFPKSASVHGTE